jgi:hypothetical protein
MELAGATETSVDFATLHDVTSHETVLFCHISYRLEVKELDKIVLFGTLHKPL